MEFKLKSILPASALTCAMFLPGMVTAGTVKMIQVFNNLYNQAATGGVAGLTPSSITAQFYNGATMCDSVVVTFRSTISEIIGTGSNQKCTDVTSVNIVPGFSAICTTLQVYSTTPVTVNVTATDFEHSIIVQDLGTGITGTPAVDGSIAPVFNTTNGTAATLGTPGYIISESKLW